MLHKSKFDGILREIRNDYENITKLHVLLQSKVQKVQKEPIDEDTKTWIMDVYLDKVYELNKKLHLLFEKMNKKDFPVNLDNALKMFVKSCHNLAYPHFANCLNVDRDPFKPLPRVAVTNELNNFIGEIEWCLSELRSNLHLSNWKELANIKPIDLTNLPRKKYVTAREEIAKAKEILEENPEDVMMHLRTAIDLSLKERFGFKDIRGMGAFIDEAKEFDFPLPSYDLIYYYFNEGSKRSHQGKVHMQFDAKEAIRTVNDFIDELETIEITQEKIDRFVRDSKSVRI